MLRPPNTRPKVVECDNPEHTRNDWDACPFAHAGEVVTRRPPHAHLPKLCPKARRACRKGRACPYAHNVFEHWVRGGACPGLSPDCPEPAPNRCMGVFVCLPPLSVQPAMAVPHAQSLLRIAPSTAPPQPLQDRALRQRRQVRAWAGGAPAETSLAAPPSPFLPCILA